MSIFKRKENKEPELVIGYGKSLLKRREAIETMEKLTAQQRELHQEAVRRLGKVVETDDFAIRLLGNQVFLEDKKQVPQQVNGETYWYQPGRFPGRTERNQLVLPFERWPEFVKLCEEVVAMELNEQLGEK